MKMNQKSRNNVKRELTTTFYVLENGEQQVYHSVISIIERESQQFPNNTNPSHCLSREHNPIGFCQEFDNLTDTYEYLRNVPGTEEYFEYAKTGGPDESCLFDVYQIKCQAFPNMNETARAQCPEGFATNEDDYCFPLHSDGCPEGYHTTEDDETGQCYPTEGDTGCEGGTMC